jgi:bifunctional non-homologous end joining protein LigD
MGGIPIEPMLAVAAPLPSGDEWVYEFKWDGIRAVAVIEHGTLRLYARSGAEITVAYPELAGLAELPDLVLDGEVVVLTAAGAAFGELAERMHVRDPARAARLAARVPVTYLVFDLLRAGDTDLCPLPWTARRDALEDAVPAGAHWVVPPVFDDGVATFAVSREQGLEGVVAKRRTGPYRPGRRSADWVKVKHIATDDFVVGGYRAGARPIGALLIGEPGPAGLTFRGRVGGGTSSAQHDELLSLLKPLRRNDSPFADPVPAEDARGTVWVTPRVVVEIVYGNRTPDGRLRFPRLHRIRTDLEA